MRFITEVDGVEHTKEEVLEDLEVSIAELQSQLNQALAFRAALREGLLTREDGYLSFGSVVENGYDRTGPQWMAVETKDG